MNKLFKMILKDVKKEKTTYISLIIVIIISIFFGTFFITILNDSDKILLKNEINNFLDNYFCHYYLRKSLDPKYNY